MVTIICGGGEIGKALKQVLSDYNPKISDILAAKTDDICDDETCDILHICFPYDKNFINQVEFYKKRFQPKEVVIHSTVPVGTSRKLDATFSMIVGIHPHLEQSIRTFTKFLAGERASNVANYFRRAGLKVYLYDKQESLELAKLSQTTQYALNIEYVKNLKRQCDELGLSFSEVYTLPSE